MARILPSGLAVDLRGSIAGLTIKLGRSGLVAGRKPLGRRTRRLSQTESTGRLSRLQARWKNTLTAAQRDAWTATAAALPFFNKSGTNHALTGPQLYASENLVRLSATLSPLDVAPATPNVLPTPAALPSFSGGTTIGWSASGQLPAAGEWFYGSLSVLVSPSANYPPKWWRQHFLIVGPKVVSQFFLIDPPLQVGGTFWIRTILLDNSGIHSTPHLAQRVL